MFKQFLVGILMFLCSATSFADMLFKDPSGNTARLFDTPCVTKKGVFSQITREQRVNAKAAEVVWQDKKYDACWVDVGRAVYIIDEAGDGGYMVKEAFVEVTPL